MSGLSVETLCPDIRFSSVMEAFPPPFPQNNLDCPVSNELGWGGGGRRTQRIN